MPTYQVGSFFVTQITGPVGFLIALGQLLAGRPSAYAHAGIIVTADGATMEAQPGGARPGHLANYGGRQTKVCDGPVQAWAAAHPGADAAAKRAEVAADALSLRGTPYSIADYLALACLHLRLPSKWIRDRVRRSGHMICSQLVSATFTRAGIDLFTDGRLPGDVMPADLADWADTWEAQR